MSERKKLKTWLRDRIVNFLDNPGTTKSELGVATSVDRKTIVRILEGSDVTLENAIPLIKFFCTSETVAATFRELVPELADAIQPQLVDPDFLFTDQVLDQVIKNDPLCGEAHFYASINGGTTREFIDAYAGYKGIEALEFLLEKGLVFESEGKIKSKKPNTMSSDIDSIVIKQDRNSKNFDRAALRDHQLGAAAQIKNTYSPWGTKALRVLAMDFISDVNKLQDDPRAQGDIPFFIQTLVGAVNRMESEKIDKEEYKKIKIAIEEIRGKK